MKSSRRPLVAALFACLGLLTARRSHAFTHVVRADETLASVAARFYGTPQMERVLVVANGLDRSGPSALTAGMLLEIPAPRYHRVEPGETWASMAHLLLGHERRATTLATSNNSQPWLPPEVGRVVSIPYNLTWVLSGEESLQTLAYRYMGSNKFAWELMQYNLLEKPELPRGRVLLIPLKELQLTPEGLRAAADEDRTLTVAAANDQAQQREVHANLDQLKAEIHAGLYVQALRTLATLRGRGGLSQPQKATVARLELEVLVALDAPGAAKEACQTLREAEPGFRFDPVLTSPKVARACPDPDPLHPPEPSQP